VSRARQTQVACVSALAADAVVEYLTGRGYLASADGATVRTDAQLSVVARAPSGLTLLVD
jgi:hypothetical protein